MSFYELGLNSDWLQILKLWFQVGVPALGCCTDASGFKVAKTALVFDGTQALIHQEFDSTHNSAIFCHSLTTSQYLVFLVHSISAHLLNVLSMSNLPCR